MEFSLEDVEAIVRKVGFTELRRSMVPASFNTNMRRIPHIWLVYCNNPGLALSRSVYIRNITYLPPITRWSRVVKRKPASAVPSLVQAAVQIQVTPAGLAALSKLQALRLGLDRV